MVGTSVVLTFFARGLSVLVPKLGIKSPFANDFISHDPEVVAAYTADPLVYAPQLTVRLGAEMIRDCLEDAAKLQHLELPHGAVADVDLQGAVIQADGALVVTDVEAELASPPLGQLQHATAQSRGLGANCCRRHVSRVHEPLVQSPMLKR